MVIAVSYLSAFFSKMLKLNIHQQTGLCLKTFRGILGVPKRAEASQHPMHRNESGKL